MTPPLPDGEADSLRPASRPGSLRTLLDYECRLAIIVEEIAARPERLDDNAVEVHEGIVLKAYELVRRDFDSAYGAQWDSRARRKFFSTYTAAASMWPAYHQALKELESARGRRSLVPSMRRLAAPRRSYITALSKFHGELRVTLNFFRAR
jgi:hypothetical protein